MTQKHEIKNRWTGKVLFSCEIPEGMESGMIARHAVETAISEGANLRCADLRCADLRCADLRCADLRCADLWGANLWGADLRGANLRCADLLRANLLRADLRCADLRCADLWGANLWGADLRGANLWGADLWGADLRGAKNAPLVINGLYWLVVIDGLGMMRIGCQNHSIERWDSFSDELINQMDSYALEFWKQHKEMLMGICNAYKHKVEEQES